jgi:predicted O-methyltransferase YrrM
VLVDIWIAMDRTALQIVAPRLRPGAVAVYDNTEQHRDSDAHYFSCLNDLPNDFRTMTLPFKGGFEFWVFCGS